MESILSVISSLTIVTVFWIFASGMVDFTLTRKYSGLKTISLWAAGYLILLVLDASLLLLHGVLETIIPETSYDILGFTIDLFIILILTTIFILCSTIIYSEKFASKLFSASFYALICLYCSDIVLIIVKIILPIEKYYEPAYYLGQSALMIPLFTVVCITIIPIMSKRLKEITKSVNGNLSPYIIVPIVTYITYLTLCVLWNSQPGSFFIIPQIVTRIILLALTVLIYMTVIYSIQNTAKIINIDKEMKLAENLIKESLPPDSELNEVPNTEISALIQMPYNVGGDFYDVFKIDDNKYGIVIGDVSGKGISAALLMMRTKTIIRTITSSSKMPGTVLKQANLELMKNNESSMFVTAFLGILNTDGKLIYSSAGHNPPLLCRNGEVKPIQCKKSTILGIIESKYEDTEITLENNDIICLYTDGVTEAGSNTEQNHEIYGIERLKSVLKNQVETKEIISSVCADIENFTGGMEQSDDIAMLVLRYRKDIS